MQVGDLVAINCAADMWYKGKPGLLIGFDHCGSRHMSKGDPLVQYGAKVIRTCRSVLKVINSVEGKKNEE